MQTMVAKKVARRPADGLFTISPDLPFIPPAHRLFPAQPITMFGLMGAMSHNADGRHPSSLFHSPQHEI